MRIGDYDLSSVEDSPTLTMKASNIVSKSMKVPRAFRDFLALLPLLLPSPLMCACPRCCGCYIEPRKGWCIIPCCCPGLMPPPPNIVPGFCCYITEGFTHTAIFAEHHAWLPLLLLLLL